MRLPLPRRPRPGSMPSSRRAWVSRASLGVATEDAGHGLGLGSTARPEPGTWRPARAVRPRARRPAPRARPAAPAPPARRWARTETSSPAAMEKAPANRPATPARRTVEALAEAPATPRTSDTLVTRPSPAPSTAARAALLLHVAVPAGPGGPVSHQPAARPRPVDRARLSEPCPERTSRGSGRTRQWAALTAVGQAIRVRGTVPTRSPTASVPAGPAARLATGSKSGGRPSSWSRISRLYSLPGGQTGQLVDEIDAARALEVGQVVPAEGDQLLGQLRARPRSGRPAGRRP